MGVDVIDRRGVKTSILQGVAHDAVSAFAVFGGRGDVIRVARHSVADDLGENRRAAALGEFQLFENQDAGAFADDEAVAVLVPGAGGLRGLVVALREGAHGGKSADAHGRDAGFGAAADHDVGIAVLDEAERIADGSGRWWCRPSRSPSSAPLRPMRMET